MHAHSSILDWVLRPRHPFGTGPSGRALNCHFARRPIPPRAFGTVGDGLEGGRWPSPHSGTGTRGEERYAATSLRIGRTWRLRADHSIGTGLHRHGSGPSRFGAAAEVAPPSALTCWRMGRERIQCHGATQPPVSYLKAREIARRAPFRQPRYSVRVNAAGALDGDMGFLRARRSHHPIAWLTGLVLLIRKLSLSGWVRGLRPPGPELAHSAFTAAAGVVWTGGHDYRSSAWLGHAPRHGSGPRGVQPSGPRCVRSADPSEGDSDD